MVENGNIIWNHLVSFGLHLKIVFFRKLIDVGIGICQQRQKKTLYQKLKEKHSNKIIDRRDFNESFANRSNSSDVKLRKQ